MSEKPEALRLADNLYAEYRGFSCIEIDAAAELRRLHAENERLREALETMLTATTNDGKEQFPGHYSAFLEQVAKPRAKAALRREDV